ELRGTAQDQPGARRPADLHQITGDEGTRRDRVSVERGAGRHRPGAPARRVTIRANIADTLEGYACRVAWPARAAGTDSAGTTTETEGAVMRGSKFWFLTGAAIGYVLGTRAG